MIMNEIEMKANVSKIEFLEKNYRPFNNFNFDEYKNKSGIYAFWWITDISFIQGANLNVTLLGKHIKRVPTIIKYKWDIEIRNLPICLYVEKTTTLKSRVSQHLLESIKWEDWYKNKLQTKKFNLADNVNNLIYKPNSVCQFRAGLQHLLKNNIEIKDLEDSLTYIGFSFLEIDNGDDHSGVGERFYLENLAIGIYRPLFNMDSER